ncbi:MAG: hypothetical protein ACKVOA_03115 [Methylophilaceae bacterium]
MSLPIIENNSDWELPTRGEKVFSLRISRKTLVALTLSILLHLALLWFFAPRLFSMGAPVKEAPPFEVSLGPPQKKEVAKVEPMPLPAEAIPERLLEPVQKSIKPKPIKEKSTPPKQVKPVEVEKKSDFSVPKVPEIKKQLPPKPKVETSPAPLPGEDMQAYIKRQKEAKLAQQGASKEDAEEVLASNNTQSEGEKRDAKIKENLKFDGTNGIFQIREMGLHSAKFSFKGWKNNINSARLEIFEVDVPEGSDGKHEVITKMIEIIRREYSGEFNWDSWRQQRVVVLSARVEDTAALESFMMTEISWPSR